MNDGRNLFLWLAAMIAILLALYFLEVFLHVPEV